MNPIMFFFDCLVSAFAATIVVAVCLVVIYGISYLNAVIAKWPVYLMNLVFETVGQTIFVACVVFGISMAFALSGTDPVEVVSNMFGFEFLITK